jgi:hypothetical protein
LHASSGGGYQWYNNEVPIPGATNQDYAPPLQTDTFSVTQTNAFGCTSYESYEYHFVPCSLAVEATITTLPNPDTICKDENLTLTVNAVFNSSYKWYKNGIQINIYGNTWQPLSSGAYYATVTINDSQCKDTSNIFLLTVDSVLPQPAISLVNDSLLSSYPEGNQWFYNGQIIPGETNQYYIPTQGGYYWINVTDSNGCNSLSDPFYFYATNVIKLTADEFFKISLDDRILHIYFSSLEASMKIKLFSSIGVKLFEQQVTKPEMTINLNEFPSGIYFVLGDNELTRVVKKFAIH